MENKIQPIEEYHGKQAQRTFGWNITNLPRNLLQKSNTIENPIPSTITPFPTINPQDCVEYVEEISKHIKDIEKKYMAKSNYMIMQADINEKMRGILIDWLVDVQLKFKLREETLFLTINMIDRFLEKKMIPRGKLQLIGITAMLIASKYEEIYPPEINDFIYISDNAYSKSEIIAMEQLMLFALNYDLNAPSSYQFLNTIFNKLKPNLKTYNMSLYLLELSLIEYKFLRHKPSIRAASALYLANRLINKDSEWDKKVGNEIGYKEIGLRQCAKEFVVIMQNVNKSSLTAVRRKFARSKYMEISNIVIGRKS